ncbi:MAG TPA: recombinase family protein [Ktedonobacteraceae bacterium]
MSGRNIKKKKDQNPLVFGYEFPLDRDGIIYVRQSSLVQFKNNIHSFEMQTDKFIEHFRNMGCTGHIEVIADDEALSGTLDIHARPGMTRMMKLIESGKVGWVGAVAVNRFTRDKWLITPGVLMKACHDHDVWIATLRMNFNFKDDYCQRVFMLEAEEAARHLEWMKLVLGGALRTASSNGYYDGRWVVPGYLVDRTDPLRKKYIVYEPHAKVVRWLFMRFLQLDADLSALCREVQQMPHLFPKFESWVDTRRLKFSLKRSKTPEGHYKPTKDGIESILTNPVYIGWWLPIGGGVIENNHEAIVEEGLFTYAHKRTSTYSLNGERQKPQRVIRYGKVEALLKRVIKDETGQSIYASPGRGGLYRCNEYDGYIVKHRFMAPVPLVDSIFLEKFFERLQSNWKSGYEDWMRKLQQRSERKQSHKQELSRQIKEAQRQRQETLDILDDPDIPKTKQMKIDYANKIAGLETRIEQWQRELERPDAEDEDEEAIHEIDQIISEIVAEWRNFPFRRRMRFVNALVKDVILSRPAPGWLRMEIRWKRPDWEIDSCFFRCTSNREAWTAEEEEIVSNMYPSEKAREILEALPDKTWSAIEHRAARLGVSKEVAADFRELGFTSNREGRSLCWLDIRFARERGLPPCAKSARWSLRPTSSTGAAYQRA